MAGDARAGADARRAPAVLLYDMSAGDLFVDGAALDEKLQEAGRWI